MKKHIEVTMLFDDVKFGIDVRDERVYREWTQDHLAHLIGYVNGVSISRIECAIQTDSMTVRRYMVLCNVLGLSPMHYWYTEEDTLTHEDVESWWDGV